MHHLHSENIKPVTGPDRPLVVYFYFLKAVGELVKDLLIVCFIPFIFLVPWRIRELLWIIPKDHL